MSQQEPPMVAAVLIGRQKARGVSVCMTAQGVLSLHQIIHYLKDKIGVVFFRCCVIFDTL